QPELQHYFTIPKDVRCTDHFVEIPSRYRIVRNIRQLVMRILGRQNPCFFDKELNGQIAESMSEADIRGLILRRFLARLSLPPNESRHRFQLSVQLRWL